MKILSFLLLAGLFLTVGCQTTGDSAPSKDGKPATAGAKKAGSTTASPGGKVKFPEPDDSWTYLKIMAMDETSQDSIAHGYVAMTKGEFRFLMEGDYINTRVYVSGNHGSITITGVNHAQWEGVLDDKTPIQLQPFFMLAQAFQLAQAAPMDAPGMKFSFRGLSGANIERGELFLGNVNPGHFFPSDLVVQYLKTKMQISLLIQE